MMIGSLLLAVQAATLPPFTFKEHEAGRKYDLQSLDDAGCTPTSEGFRCSGDSEMAGWRVFLSYTIIDAKLSTLAVIGNRNALADVIPALQERYGAPCEKSTATVRNGFGAVLNSAEFTWCFRTGKLTLHERYGRIDEFSLVYVDAVNLPPRRIVQPDF